MDSQYGLPDRNPIDGGPDASPGPRPQSTQPPAATGEEAGRHLEMEDALGVVSRLLASRWDDGLGEVTAILGRATSAARSYALLLREGPARMDNVYEWHAPGVSPRIDELRDLDVSRVRWLMEALRRGESVAVADVACLGREAQRERAMLEARGARAFLAIPLCAPDGEFLGFMGFEDAGGPRAWQPRDVKLLRVAGDLVSGHLSRIRAEETARETELFGREVLENIHNVIYIINRDGIVLSLNAAFERATGWRLSDVVGKHLSDILHPDDLPVALERVRSAFDGRPVKPAEIRVPTAAGQYRYAECRGVALSRNGRVVAMLGIGMDVTERRRAEEDLRESRRMLATLLANLPGMAYRCRNDRNWTMEFVSEGAKALTGYSADDLVRRHRVEYVDVIHPDERTYVWETVQQAVRERKPFEAVYRIVTAAGEEKWVNEVGRGVFTDDGRLVALEGFIADVTDRKRSEEALRQSEANYRTIFDSANDAIVALDPSTAAAVDANEAFCRMLKCTREEALALTVDRLFLDGRPYGSEDAAQWAQKALAEPQVFDWSFRALDGSIVQAEISLKKAVIADRECLLAVVRDISARKKAEALLRVRNAAIETSISPIAFATIEGRITYGNPAFLRMWGYSDPAEVVGRLTREFWVDDRETAMVLRALREKGSWAGERVGRRRDGTLISVQLIASAVHDESRGETCIMASFMDVTERRRTEIALRDSEANYRAIFDAVNDAIFVHDIDTGAVLDVNRSMCEMFKCTPEQARNSAAGDCAAGYPPYNAEGIASLIAKARTGPQLFEWHAKDFEGRCFWAEVNLKPTSIGARRRLLAVVRDITERKRAEEELRSTANLLSNIIDQSPFSTWISDATGTHIRQNAACRRLFNMESDDVAVGKYCFFRDPILEEQGHLEEIRKVFTEGRTARFVTDYDFARVLPVAPGPDTRRRLFVTVFPVKDASGKVVNAVVQHEDMTERKRLEEQLRQSQKMEAIGRLAGGIAHDFNNLLAAIMGYSDLALTRLEPGDPVRRDVEEIRKAGERAAGVTRQLLTFSRKQVLELRPLDPNAVIAGMDGMLSLLAGESVLLAVRLDRAAGLVRADSGQLEQVVMNLAMNARDAMPDGGTLTIETAPAEVDAEQSGALGSLAPGRYVMVSVADTGCGMDAETRSHLFEPFFTTKEKGKGTGLGLATVYGIVQQAGGTISVTTAVGAGTAFRVYLPRWEGQAAPQRAPGRSHEQPADCRASILLVEDEDGIRDFMTRLIEAHGFDVIAAGGGEAALAVCADASRRIDLLVTDVTMPGMNGTQLAARAAEMRPGISVLYVSGYVGGAKVSEGVGPEARFLEKPFTSDALVRAIREALGA